MPTLVVAAEALLSRLERVLHEMRCFLRLLTAFSSRATTLQPNILSSIEISRPMASIARPAAWMFSILSVLVCWAAAEQACPAEAHRSVTKALLQTHKNSAGVYSVEKSQSDQNRSTGCGMGVAGECVATMDWRHMLASLAPGSSANFFNTFLKASWIVGYLLFRHLWTSTV